LHATRSTLIIHGVLLGLQTLPRSAEQGIMIFSSCSIEGRGMGAVGHIIRVTDAEHDVTVFTVGGAVDAAEVSGHIMAFLTGDPTPLVLWDIRAGSVAGLSLVDVMWIIKRAEPFADRRRGGRTAIVCAQTLDYAVSRMFQSFAEVMQIPFEIAVFRDHEEARRWLNESMGGEGADGRPRPLAGP
jgi:hypothetical protein